MFEAGGGGSLRNLSKNNLKGDGWVKAEIVRWGKVS